MTPQPVPWSKIAQLFQLLAYVYRADGKTLLPACAEEPSVLVDASCDHWCRIQAENLNYPLNVPAELRPWMLARAISVAALAETLSENGETSPGPLTRSLIERLLIEEWHGALRDRWMRRAPSDS